MKCPACNKEITHYLVSKDLAWCDDCRIAFYFSSLQKGEPEAVLQLVDSSDCPRGVNFTCEEHEETVSTRSFSFLGIPLALLCLLWLFMTVFSFTIHVGLALLMALMLLGIFVIAATALFCKLSLTFHPETGEIVYAKGPFPWLRIKRRFNGKDVAEVREGALLAAEGDIPRPVVFLKNKKSYMLDFSKNDEKREFMELVLCTFIARS